MNETRSYSSRVRSVYLDARQLRRQPTAALGYITMWPQGTPRPLAATLNAVDGAITSNMAIVPTANGKVSVFTANTTHLVLDIFGYFAP